MSKRDFVNWCKRIVMDAQKELLAAREMAKKPENQTQTMRRMIAEYNTKNAVGANVPHFYDEHELIKAAESMNAYARSAMQRPEYDWSGYAVTRH